MADFIKKILEKWIYYYIVNHKSKSSLNSLFGLLRLSTKPLIFA